MDFQNEFETLARLALTTDRRNVVAFVRRIARRVERAGDRAAAERLRSHCPSDPFDILRDLPPLGDAAPDAPDASAPSTAPAGGISEGLTVADYLKRDLAEGAEAAWRERSALWDPYIVPEPEAE